MAKEPTGKKHRDGLAENLLFSFMPILFVLIICLGMLCFNRTASATEILFQMVTGGDIILCSFAVLLPSYIRFPWEKGNHGFFALLLVGLAEAILYVVFKIFSGSESCNLFLIILVSIVCVAASTIVSYISQERAEEARQTEEPVEQIVNAEEVAK